MPTDNSTPNNKHSQNTSSAEGEGSENNPFLATADADTFAGSEGADWVSYARSTQGIYVVLDSNPADGGWAANDRVRGGGAFCRG